MEQTPAVEALQGLLAKQLRAVERAEPGVRAGGEEDLHRLRVAMRRSRALIRAARPLIGDQLATSDRGLRWVAAATGPVRDLDVMIEHLEVLRYELEPDQAGVDALITVLERRRAARRIKLLELLETERYQRLKRRFATALERLEPVGAEVSLARLAGLEFRRLRGAYDELGMRPPDDELHAVRIRAKHARYAAELAALADRATFSPLAEALRELQDLIGVHQDAVVAAARVRTIARPDSALAAGRIIELEFATCRRIRVRVPEVWARVKRVADERF